MSILDLFKLSKDPTQSPHRCNELFIGKLYNATLRYGDTVYDVDTKSDLVSEHYRLFLKYHDKYYIIPHKEGLGVMIAKDINDLEPEDGYTFVVQPDVLKRFKPLTYYAPSAEFGFVTPEQMKRMSSFIHHYFVKGDDNAHRRDLDIYYKYLKNEELTDEEKARLMQLKDFAKKNTNENEYTR